MKHNTEVFFRFLAILTIIFLGITAIIPQTTKKDDAVIIPVWNDVNAETDVDIISIYKKGIIVGGIDGEYGVNEPFTAFEASYAVLRMYEDKNKKEHSFNHFNPDIGEKYIKKAKEYKIWNKTLPTTDEPLSREQFAAVMSPLAKGEKSINEAEILPNADRYVYVDDVFVLYNAGIMLDKSISTAYTPDKVITRGEAVKLVAMYLDEDKRIVIKTPDYKVLQTQLVEKMTTWQGDWSLYFEDVDTGGRISINSHQVYSASLIKMFVAQTAYQKIAEGKLTETAKLNDEIRKMLTYSDNEAWKYVARSIGGGGYSQGMIEMTKLAQASGFFDTGQFYQGEHKNYNFTSVNDCGAYLKGLLDGTIVNAAYSEKILSLLKQQQHRQKIPAGIPDTVKTANKTGELDYIQGDAAIVYAPSGTYILVIIGDDLQDGYGQIDKICELSSMVYAFLN